MRNRYARARYLSGLDPEKDCHEIHRVHSRLEFPWDYGRGLEIALWKACCVPAVSEQLHRSGHVEHLSQKRYDDTRILLGEIVANGTESLQGRQAIRQINRAHRGVTYANEDMLYILSTFIYEPVHWIDRWGWRRVTDAEKLGSFYFFRRIGRLMNIDSLPEDYDSFLEFKNKFEKRCFRYAESNRQVSEAILRLYVSWYPGPIARLMSPVLPARLDERARHALGLPDPGSWARAANTAILTAHAYFERLAPRTAAKLTSRPAARTYPGYPAGYDLSKIGPMHDAAEPSKGRDGDRVPVRHGVLHRRKVDRTDLHHHG
ncbi:oxygenase MpaB family protein [Amycolatopsis thailandensis]|uniref:oxygenase MpaB family protein n=1 Tax=Amycolatopsis thailandensis TaxID=589330 RepID=UPI0011773C6F|nr:oxygenase MpaB family protein [Amycolatopsis thailandensis]